MSREKSRYCSNCGTPIESENAAFCAYCGSKL
ncbi:MAG: zinc-ribbon domain-containing protein [Promethearchaeota archaeon]